MVRNPEFCDMSAYELIIAGSLAIIVSYFYSEISRKTSIPSVIMLIATGVLLGLFHTVEASSLKQILEVLGVVGLIMIVLEGALGLELSKEKLPLVKRATALAFFSLVGSILFIGLAIRYAFGMDIWISLVYATPLSVVSSAIVIPSVEHLAKEKKEFLIYESCISDIIGIMLFYLLLGMLETDSKMGELGMFSINLTTTVVISLFTSFGLIVLFKYIKSKVKIFMFLAILMVLYAIEKSLHLSPLILILLFGLMLKNNELVFKGRWAGLISRMELKLMERNFHIITRETAFVLRTFFFIAFGLSMDLNSLGDMGALILSIAIVLVMFLIRWLALLKFGRNQMKPLLFVAPRGLITVMLFYSIPSQGPANHLPESVILYVVLITSFIMTFGLVMETKETIKPRPRVHETI